MEMEAEDSFIIKKEEDSHRNSYTEVLPPMKQEPMSQEEEDDDEDDDDDDDKGKLYIEEQPMEDSVKEESMSEDDVPLSARQPVKQEIDSEDDEPLLARCWLFRASKQSSKKRKKSEDDDYEESDDSDYGAKKPAKKKKKPAVKSESPKKAVKRERSTSKPATSTTPRAKKAKKEEDQDVWKWWEDEKMDDGQKWRTLWHKGPVFAPPYEPLPKNVKFYYNGKVMELSEGAEEVAGFYARMLDHDYVTKERFNDNFFKDWRKMMTPKEAEIIKDLSKCNFKEIGDYYKMKSEERKAMTKEEKLVIKEKNEELLKEYGFCIIDGHRQKIANFKIEPPGLFRGRGEHPKMGMLKRRVVPEDVIINIGKGEESPTPPDGHKWKKVQHDNTVTWLASWTENILGQTKYIMLNPSSKLKGEKDWQKYETARRLKSHAPRIREEYQQDWKSKEMKVRQRAVALYFIDKLALRAGNEKEESETADTVGCCSLRVEHIELHREKDGKEYVVDFDFLGKDSIRYNNSVPVEKQVFKNLKLFMENKQPGDDLFDRLNTGILNKHLNELMEGLTAKVFRTYNASKTLQEQLDLLTKEEMSIPEKLLAYNRANRAVAILCNHQRSVPKTFSKQMETLQQKLNEKKDQIQEVKKDLKQLKRERGQAYDKKMKRLNQLEGQLLKLEVQATDKEENKQIALGTSKLNYLDPRISVAWCKKWDVPIEKIYNKTQRDKFRWAIEMAEADYSF
ncbi:TOP1 [Cordylochernes scorpioides]|uniref:DNA topoisomerase I n=1 Tax=Cordylochernes scorpioides TaxID=51811 RepID=A0ABY6L7X0_9ARAC|nr:TOP1 [Cordylochernes scorpioides]